MNVFLKKCFSIQNYNKPLKAQNITRFHNYFRYDEYANLIKNPIIEKAVQQQEKIHFEKVKGLIDENYQKYYKVCSQRKDPRTQELPEQFGDYLYYSKSVYVNFQDHSILYRKQNGSDEELVLDLFEIPFVQKKHHNTALLAQLQISDDHSRVAFLVDLNNSEEYMCGIKDLKKNKFLKDRISDVCSIKFSANGDELIYVKYDDKKRGCQVFKHKIGTYQEEDTLIYQENDEQFYLDLQLSQDKQYILIQCSNKEIQETLMINRQQTQNPPQIIFSRNLQSKGFTQHSGNHYYILSNMDQQYDLKVVRISDQNIQQNNFTYEDFYTPRETEKITDINIFQSHLILYVQKNGISSIKIIDLQDQKQIKQLELPKKVVSLPKITPALNENYNVESFRFHVDTPLSYNQIFEYNLKNDQLKMLEDFKINGPPFNKDLYKSYLVHVPASDGEMIPVSLIHKKKQNVIK